LKECTFAGIKVSGNWHRCQEMAGCSVPCYWGLVVSSYLVSIVGAATSLILLGLAGEATDETDPSRGPIHLAWFVDIFGSVVLVVYSISVCCWGKSSPDWTFVFTDWMTKWNALLALGAQIAYNAHGDYATSVLDSTKNLELASIVLVLVDFVVTALLGMLPMVDDDAKKASEAECWE